MLNFIHQWMNPHCPDCAAERENLIIESACRNCQTLRDLLETERHTNKQLLNTIIELTHPKPIVQQVTNEKQPLQTAVSWRIRQQMLEAEDKKRAGLIREAEQEKVESKKTTEQLERELGVTDGTSVNSNG